MRKTGEIYSCDFCGKHQFQVEKTITGMNGAAICSECVAVAVEIIAQERKARENLPEQGR